MKRARTIIIAPLILILFTACPAKKSEDLLGRITPVIELAAPFVTSLGLLPATAEPIIKDFTDALPIGKRLAADLGVAVTLADKLTAANRAQRDWLVIVNRGHFKFDPRVLGVANTISGIYSAIVGFYGPSTGDARPDEKAFAKDLDQRIKTLREQMK